MTTEATTDATTSSPETTTQSTPQVDIEKIVNDRIKKAEGNIHQNVTNKIIKSLGGGEEDRENPIHTALIAKPEEFVTQLIKTAKEEAVAEMTQSLNVKEEAGRAFTLVAEEFPDIRKVKNEVLAEFSQMDTSESVGERMSKASKKVVERMGWKSKTQKANESSVADAAMSPSGYQTSRPELKEAASQLTSSSASFIAQRKAQHLKNTGREIKKP